MTGTISRYRIYELLTAVRANAKHYAECRVQEDRARSRGQHRGEAMATAFAWQEFDAAVMQLERELIGREVMP